MKNYKITLILLFFISNFILAQPSWVCGTTTSSVPIILNTTPGCSYSSPAFNSIWNLQATYLPDSTKPLIIVKYAMHIFNNTAQSTSMYKNNPTDLARLNYINNTIKLYSQHSHYRQGYTFPNHPNQILDSRVRYECVGIYFYYNDTLYNNTVFGTLKQFIKTNYVDNNIDPTRLDALPIFFMNGTIYFSPGAAGYAEFPDYNFSNPKGVVTLLNANHGDWFAGEHLLHEIGHNVGWKHTYQDEALDPADPDFLSDVFLQNNPACPQPFTNAWGTCYTHTCSVFSPSTNCSNNVMSGNDNKWMSNLQMGRRRKNLYLLNIRNYVKDTTSQHTYPILINSNQTWDFDIQMYEDIVVKTGNTLKITCKINMAREGRIIVEKGAKLIIDAGEITTWSKTGRWDGIYLEGTSNMPQYLPEQSQLEIKNNALIQNANIAVNTFVLDASNNIKWNSTGGIIFAENSTFLNNIKDVQFMYYHSPNGMPNVCKFKNVTFKIDDNYRNGSTPDARVSLYEVSGVQFLGCSLINLQATVDGNNNYAFRSYDAQYFIDKLGTSNSFIHRFTYGVYADNSNPLRLVSVKNTSITESYQDGIYFNNMHTPVIEDNTITTPGFSGLITNTSSCIYLNNCKNYNVRNNTFSQIQTWLGLRDVGVFVNNSGNGTHHIYRNNFSHLVVGIDAMNDNSGVTNFSDGLKMNCNNFDFINKNYYDIALVGNSPTVMHLQGSLISGDLPNYVRNRYGSLANVNGISENQWYIANNSTKAIWHPAYSDANTRPTPQPALSDVSINVFNSTSPFSPTFCPTSNLPAPLGCPCSGCCKLVQINTEINNSKVKISNAINTYTNILDGGNTQTLLNAINSGTSNGNLKNMLLNYSPYLSDTVLISYFNKPSIPNGHLKQIHAANAPVNNKIWQVLLEKNIPNGIMSQMTDIQNSKHFSDRSKLEGNIINAQFDLKDFTSQKLNYFLTDTLQQSLDSVISVLNLNKSVLPNATSNLFFAYINKSNFTEAERTLKEIKSLNPTYGIYLQNILSLQNSTNKAYTINANENLNNYFINYANDTSKTNYFGAQALLKFTKNTDYFKPKILPIINSDASQRINNNFINALNNKSDLNQIFNLYPNPVNNTLNFTYNLSNNKLVTKINIIDVLGKVIYSKENNSLTNIQIDLIHVPDGLYLFSAYYNNELIYQSKFVKSK